jgi:hypothetical protein
MSSQQLDTVKRTEPPLPTGQDHGLLASTLDTGKKVLSTAVKTGEDVVHYTHEKVSELLGGKEDETKSADDPSRPIPPSGGIFGATKSVMASATSTLSSLLGMGHAEPLYRSPHEKKCANLDCACADCKGAEMAESQCKNRTCTCPDCSSGGMKNTRCKNPLCACENCQCAEGECGCGK